MILYPAIDLKDGAAVRLLRGEMGQATLYNPDPAAQARDFAEAGFEWLHLVDLNGAFEGRPVNAAAVEAILAAVELPVQLGGGIRDMETIERWLTAGVRRVILGTAEIEISDKFVEAAKRYKEDPTALHLRGMNMIYEGIKQRGTIVLLPSGSLSSMSLGSVLDDLARGKVPGSAGSGKPQMAVQGPESTGSKGRSENTTDTKGVKQ